MTQQAPGKPDDTIHRQLVALVRAIPAGRVIAYGALGARCEPPISGYFCGRIMGRKSDEAMPWWRVVAKNGTLPLARRSPELSRGQRETLEEEGVRFDADGRIETQFFLKPEEELVCPPRSPAT